MIFYHTLHNNTITDDDYFYLGLSVDKGKYTYFTARIEIPIGDLAKLLEVLRPWIQLEETAVIDWGDKLEVRTEVDYNTLLISTEDMDITTFGRLMRKRFRREKKTEESEETK